jgi:hypothetical protein
MMPLQDANFYLEIYWKHSLENDEAVILVNSLLPKKGRLVWDTTFSYTYSKRTKQALIWTPRLLALKTIVEEKLEKPTILVCLIYITQVPKEWAGTVMPRKKKKKWSYRLCKFWCRTKITFKHRDSKETVSENLSTAAC